MMVLVVVLVLLVMPCGALPAPAGPEPSLARQLQDMLQEAELKLFSSDSSRLDVARAVQLLQQVHSHVSSHFGTAVMQAGNNPQMAAPAVTGDPRRPKQGHSDSDDNDKEQQQKQGGEQSNAPGSRPSGRKARRGARTKKPRAGGGVWQELGRASFTLAALSASGLISEHLPAPAAATPAATAALCRQLHAAAADRAGPAAHARGSSGSSSPACQVVASDPRVLQELEWLHTAAAAGTVEAQMALADRFLMGRGGVNASCSDGLAWLQQAATVVMRRAEAAGNWDLTPSFIRLRERFIDVSSPQSYAEWDEEQMAHELQAAAAFGSSDSYAQRRLGYRLLLGRGVSLDYRAAYEQLVTAADGGNDGYALYNLGVMYLKGWYVARDPQQALQYFKRALERGVGAAANAIGVLAAYGEALPPDFTAAARWFEKGANMSDTDSIYNMGTLYLHGRGVSKDVQSALNYYGMAFDLGHWKASYALGMLYAGNEPGLGHNCEYAEKYFWQFVSQRSGWLTAAQAALQDYDNPSKPSTTPAPGGGRGGGQGGGAASAPGDRHQQALVRFLLLAESGCEAAAENAAWMLLHGQGAGGPRAMGLAAHLLYRSSILNHTSSMVELARLLLNDSLVTHPQQLEQAAARSGALLAHPAALAPADDNATFVPNVSLGLLHNVLLQQRNAFMPPVAGPTACTGLYRRGVPALVQNVSNSTAVVPTARSTQPVPAQQRRQQGLSDGGAAAVASDAAGVVVWRARRAAVAWLFEASSVGDAEASALLGWLWHDGVLQGSRAQQEALAVITRALAEQSQPGQHYALWLAHSLISLEQTARRWLGWQPVAAVRSTLAAVRDAAVVAHGLHPAVLDMPDGFASVAPPSGRSGVAGGQHGLPSWGWVWRLRHAVLSAQQAFSTAVSRQQHSSKEAGRGGDGRMGPGHKAGGGGGWWEAVGADRVDAENLVLTCLLGALAGVLWLHVRQQGQQAARRGAQAAQAAGRNDTGRGQPQQMQVQPEQEQQQQQVAVQEQGTTGQPPADGAAGLRQRPRRQVDNVPEPPEPPQLPQPPAPT